MRERWKRIISVILVSVLCLTSLDTGFGTISLAGDSKNNGWVTTGESGINLVNNAGFEYGTSDVEAWGKNLVDINTDAAYVHSGTRSLKVAAGQTATAYAFSGLNASYNLDAAIKAGMWVYLSDANDAEKTLIVLERKEGNNILLRPEKKIGWQKVVLAGEEISGCIEHVMKFEVAEGNAGDVYFDDAFVYSADEKSINILRNDSFESSKDAWGGNFDVVTDEHYAGSNAAKITGVQDLFQASGWWPNKQSANTNETLYYSFWVKGASPSGELKLRAEVKSGLSNTVANHYSGTGVTGKFDWKQLYVEIPYPGEYVNEVLFHIETTGDGIFYVDGGKVSAVKPEVSTPDISAEDRTAGVVVTGEKGINLANNAGFEYGTSDVEAWGKNLVDINTDAAYVHSGTQSLKVAAGQTATAYAFSGLNASYNLDAAVKAGMWVYLSDANDADKTLIVVERKNSDGSAIGNLLKRPEAKTGWQKVVLTGEEISDCTEHVMKFEVAEGNAGDVYFDDAFVYSVDEKSINILRNDGFESNKDAWAGNFDVVTDEHYAGSNAAKIMGEQDIYQASAWWPNKQSANTEETLYYSFWVKGIGSSGELKLRAEVKYDSSNQVVDYYSPTSVTGTSDWTLLCVKVPYPEAAISEILFHVVTTGEGVFYADGGKVSAVSPVSDDYFNNQDDGNGEDEESGLLRNASLETLNSNGTVLHWDAWPGNPAEGISKAKSVTDVVHSGGRALKVELVQSNAQAVYQYCVDTSAFDFNADYKASVWVKLENVSSSGVTLGVKRKGVNGEWHNLYTSMQQGTSDGWVQITLDAPATDVRIVQYDVIVDIGAGSGAIYLDDFDLVKAQFEKTNGKDKSVLVSGILRNSSLETLNADGTILHWDTWPGKPEEGINQSESVTNVVHSGERALKIQLTKNNGQAVYQYCTDISAFDFNQDYIASVWVKLENVQTSKLSIGVKRKDAAGKEYNVFESIPAGTTKGWVKVQVEAPSVDAKIIQYDVIVDVGEGSGVIYLDDFDLVRAKLEKVKTYENSILRNPSLESLNTDGSILHWDVWPGKPEEGIRQYASVTDVVHSGKRAVKIELTYANGQAIYQYCVDKETFDFNADYIASVWVKLEKVAVYDGKGITLGVKRTDAEGKVHLITENVPLGTSDGWIQITLEAPAINAEIIQYDVIVDIGAGSGMIYLDDFDLVAAELEEAEKVPERVEAVLKEEPALGDTKSSKVSVVGIIIGGGAISGLLVLAGIIIWKRRKKRDSFLN